MENTSKRRHFLKAMAAASTLSLTGGVSLPAIANERLSATNIKLSPDKMNIGIFVYPRVTMLDAYAPLQLLAVSRQFNVFTFGKTGDPVYSDANVDLMPNYGFDNCPKIDVLIVPGSANPIEQLDDPLVISFLKAAGEQAKYITSVCTGALILAETGLLDGYKTTTHWAYVDILKHYPKITYVNERVVKDRNRISGGGVTAGLDFAITLVADLAGKQQAQALELLLEYDPQPPFKTGNPNLAPPKLKQMVQNKVNNIAKDLFIRGEDSVR